MAYSARTVANYLIEQAKIKNVELTPMQLLKLIYIAHGWNLAINERPLIKEDVEAWKYGPVISNIYHAVKHWGNGPVKEPLSIIDSNESELFQEEKDVIDRVLSVYGNMSGIQLSNLTHSRGTPWHEVYFDKGGQTIPHTKIPNELIKSHFIELSNR